MIYRPATLADAPALAALGAETFIAAFGHLYTEADLTAFDGIVATAQVDGCLTRARTAFEAYVARASAP